MFYTDLGIRHAAINKTKKSPCPYEPYISVSETDEMLVKM